MYPVLRDSWSLLLGTGVVMVAHGLTTTLLGIRGASEGFSSFSLGMVMAGFYAGFLLSSRITPGMLRRVGHVRVYAAYASGASACLILLVAVIDPIVWTILRVTTGFFMAGIYVVAESWLNGINANANRARALSLYVGVQLAGSVVGQVLIAAGDTSGYGLFIVSTVLMSLAIGPMLLIISPVPVFETAQPMSFREIHDVSPLAFFGTLGMGAVFGSAFTMTAVYGAEIGLPGREIAALVGGFYIGGVLTQYPMGWLSDNYGRRPVLAALFAVSSLTAALGLVAGTSLLPLLLVIFIIGAAFSPVYSIMVAHANDQVDPERMAACGAQLIFLQGVGAIIGPILSGAAMSLFGPEAFFALIALLTALLTGFTLYRTTCRPAVATEFEVGFSPLPHKTSVVGAAIYADVVQTASESE